MKSKNYVFKKIPCSITIPSGLLTPEKIMMVMQKPVSLNYDNLNP
jgi:hypothetical protein